MQDVIADTLDHADAVAEWLVASGEQRLQLADANGALHYAQAAASIMSRQNRTLVLPSLENLLQRVARWLPVGAPTATVRDASPVAQPACLHVLTEALSAGGLTAMAMRWIENDSSIRSHSVALLAQQVSVPDDLRAVVRSAGGNLHIAPDVGPAERAVWLRELACSSATHVILHVDVSDVICPAAFGVYGGPPVMLVNHSAHVFWTGTSTTDLVLNCRGSELEGTWAARHRGLPTHGIAPIPLPRRAEATVSATARVKAQALTRAHYGIPDDAVVLLTVGAMFKFLPANGLDFIEVCRGILETVPDAVLLGVGIAPNARWDAASAKVGGRIKALGTLDRGRLAELHDITDVYLEGFPFGTTTALLEAGSSGMPFVLSPADCPPPYGSDGIAIDDLVERPENAQAFAARVIQLCREPALRQVQGALIANSVQAHHQSPGWNAHLERELAALPAVHKPRVPVAAQPTPQNIHRYWTNFVRQWGAGYVMTLETAILQAMNAGLRPTLGAAIVTAARRYQGAGDREVPLAVLQLLCNTVMLPLPLPLARRLFQLATFVFRPSLVTRVLGKLRGGSRPHRPVWYAEFRGQRN